MSPSQADQEIEREQHYVDRLYARVDELRTEVQESLDQALLARGSSERDLLEREASVDRLTERATALDRAEQGLCFGRLDLEDGHVRYVGRTGLRAPAPERTPLLLDWRAPGARAFYVATPANNHGVVRRRHLRTERRRVTGVEDELLDLDAFGADGSTLDAGTELQGEGALMAALAERRTGRMRDIVTTLQAEQDDVVRATSAGVLVVQGGPGTGKTAVALHRAAYLLYARPEVARQGVLVVGPSTTFLDYIEQVLPSLGETQVVLTTTDGLFPGVTPTVTEPAEVVRLKGEAAMAEVLVRAVRDRERAVDVEVRFDGEVHRLPAKTVRAAADEASRAARTHNVARRTFRELVLRALAMEVVGAGYRLLQDVEEGFENELARFDTSLSRSPDEIPARVEVAGTEVDGVTGVHELPHVERELLADPYVTSALEDIWPLLTPQQLLEDLFGDPDRLASASRGLLDGDERALLHREPGSGWSAADVPLLDEAAELLGVDETESRQQRAAHRREAARFARQVLRSNDLLAEEADGDAVDPAALLTEEDLAGRHAARDHRSFAEKAAADRTWTYGHVVVDEAQELSAMTWRALFRRCPAGSMTVVGDVHQGSGPSAATSWELALAPHTSARIRQQELTVGYRTPEEVMAAATPVLAALDPGASVPTSVRSTGLAPRRVTAAPDDLAGAVAATVARDRPAGGSTAVVAPAALVPVLRDAVADAPTGTDLLADVVVLSPAEAKGLEFDAVVVAEPAGIIAEPRGLGQLYVAMTRTTGTLTVVHTGEIPDVLAHLEP
ncbi:AAA family ATPase [Georgenia halophila]|uniref:AAA family ATPase n=1 Tax=Georgenia halophila TaxID=620889 RepID=A0ABP8L522_9MICO